MSCGNCRRPIEWIGEQARRVPGFRVEGRIVLANFAYAKLAMVRDLDGALDELVAHDLIAALAGDEQAREAIRGQGPGPGAIPGPDQVPLADEFLVLDADSSQNYAINAVLAGQSLIVKGPPGTGKSQTIANLIASLIARGKKVLFVAEKRAAIDAVTKRLAQQDLGELVLDLHDGVTSRRAFAQMIGRALDASRNAPRLDNGAELQRVERRREQLNGYVGALHGVREPWGLSVYDMRARLLGLEPARTEFRLRGRGDRGLGGAAARQAAEDLAQYARLGGLTLLSRGSPWARSPIVSAEEVRRADEVLDEVRRHALPGTLALLERASGETGLPQPQTLAGWAELIEVWAQVGAALSAMTPAVYELDLQAACEALAPAGRGGAGAPVGGADLGPVPGGPGAAAHGAAARAQAGRPGPVLLRRGRPGQRPQVGRPRRAGDPACPARAGRMPGVLRAPARPARPAGSMVRAARPGPDAGRGLRADPGPA